MLKKLLVLVFGVGVPLVMIAVVFLGYNWVFESNVSAVEPYHLYVYPDENPRDVLNKLLKDSVVASENSFVMVAKQKKWNEAKPGHYVIEPGMSNSQMVNMLRGGWQTPVSLTINMANSLAAACGQIGQQVMADSATLFTLFTDEEFLRENGFTFATIRAAIIPNTYEVYWSETATKMRDRLLREYRAFWNDSRKALAKGIALTPVEVSILASIVEKETAKKDEMPVVAGLYINRLQKGMLLQSDPTVVYANKLVNPDFEANRVLYKDLEIDSPYNTYKYLGLPPAPITIPSITAIDAVLHAQKHDYIYMCADAERVGYHLFAKNHAQHILNAKKYQAWLNNNRVMR